VGRQAICPCDADDLIKNRLLPYGAAADIGGLLDAHHRLRRLIAGARVKGGPQGIRRESPVGARQCGDLEPPERRVGAALSRDDVRGRVREDFIAWPAMHQRSRDVAHGTGRHEHGGLLTEKIGNALTQQVHGRVVADLFVADVGTCHGLPHAWRRAALGIRQEVDADGRRLWIARGRGIGHDIEAFLAELDLNRVIAGLVLRTGPERRCIRRPILSIRKGPGKTGASFSVNANRSNQRE
jgi:hypothetical protein